jgi:predicted DNA binding CopG/RHH family protein
MAERPSPMVTIHSWDEVPQFSSEAEESEWWGNHDLGGELLDQFKPVPLTPAEIAYKQARTRPVAVRFDESTLERIRNLAKLRNKGYQTLLKEFVVERLYEEEKREGIVK